MKLVIIGQGGHSKVVRDIVISNKQFEIVAYLDDRYEEMILERNIFYGPILEAKRMNEYFNGVKFVIAIGNNKVRNFIAQQLGFPEHYFVTLIHSKAVVSESAKIGYGTVVMANVVINADVQIGNHAIINTSSVVEHDNNLGNFVHISPNATLTGTVKVGEGTQIGAGAVINPNIEIGEWSTIGAGATVINNIPSYSIAVGTPARIKEKINLGGVLDDKHKTREKNISFSTTHEWT